MAHGVVAEVAGQAAAEARHAGAQGDLEARLVLFDEVERIAFVLFDHDAVLDDFGALAIAAQHGRGRQADEGIAAEAFAADDGFKQKGVLAALLGLCQFQVQGERCFQVGERFRDQGDAVVALLGQRFEFEFGHVSLHAVRVCVCIVHKPCGGLSKNLPVHATCAKCAKDACAAGSNRNGSALKPARIASVAKARPQSSRFG
ncbi:hypothetical protein D3C72_1492590 [compost metagenome]